MQAQGDFTTAPQTPGTATSGQESMQRQRGGLQADHTSTTYHMGNNSCSDRFSNLAFICERFCAGPKYTRLLPEPAVLAISA